MTNLKQLGETINTPTLLRQELVSNIIPPNMGAIAQQ